MIVTACEKCPCSVEATEDDVAFCNHPDAPEDCEMVQVGGYYRGVQFVPATWPIPSWCPLRVAPLTIEVAK